ncbi:PTS sugar transporter subunit IIA [Enterovibrio paralichthyis]|uniref:PTS sugar transporter subunit IIA n=1 Tax=Enterovibrio paralichthyis TaxID=2853805 RepID=UPI001C46EE91|nr:PTS sugar transporter subunit IIA [Enterovibrio paralichthyis]MBV7298495.1 PTS sugar transporter subunit IIA [Enterovibrio paralichthyis]
MTNVFSSQHILTDTQSTTQEAAFRFIAENAHRLGVVSSVDGFAAGLKAREEHDSTGFMGGIAVPHCKSEHVMSPAIFVVRFAHPIAWETMDDEPVSAVVSLAIPAEGAQESLVMLTKVSRAMMKPDIRNTLQTGDTETVVDTIHHLIA